MAEQAVIFDLDGTLLNTLDDLADSVNEILARSHLPTHPTDAYRMFVGEGARVLIERALPENRRDEGSVRQHLEAFHEVYRSRWSKKTEPYEGILPMLSELSRREVPFAVLSNKPDSFTRLCVERFLPGVAFGEVRGMRDSVPRKPDPEGALEIARLFGTKPEEILFVGDSSIDMKTACAAGMYAIGVAWGFRSREELCANGARKILENPLELLELLSGHPAQK